MAVCTWANYTRQSVHACDSRDTDQGRGSLSPVASPRTRCRALRNCHFPSGCALPTSSILETSAAVRTRKVIGTSCALTSPLCTVSMLLMIIAADQLRGDTDAAMIPAYHEHCC